MVILAGCTGPASQPEEKQGTPGMAFSGQRLDTDGDGFVETLELQLHGSAEPIARDEIEVQLDGATLEIEGLENATIWAPGNPLRVPCPEGTNEYRILIRGELVRLLVLECGIPPAAPQLVFRASLIDGDGDGDEATVQLALLAGGPVPVAALSARFGQTPLGLFEDALKSHPARGTLENGTELYTACDPDAYEIALLWGERELPPMTVRGCQAYEPGLDAPIQAAPVDVDADGAIDGLNLLLGNSSAAPFPLEDVNATWGNATATLNASTALEPPPAAWASNTTLVASCPGDGEQRFDLAIDGSLVLRRFLVCQAPPGAPLVALNLTAQDETLEATLTLSRAGPLALENVTDASGTPIGEGIWEEKQTVSLPCPDGQLVLRYDQRLAYRGPAPC